MRPNIRSRGYAHKIQISSREVLKTVFSAKGHNSRVIETIISNWRDSTLDSYNTCIQFWVAFNSDKLVLDPKPFEVTDFLQCLYDSGIKYLGCNIARSALCSIIFDTDKTIGKNEEVVRFMKGLLQNDPPLPHYSKTWDLNHCPKIFAKMVAFVYFESI